MNRSLMNRSAAQVGLSGLKKNQEGGKLGGGVGGRRVWEKLNEGIRVIMTKIHCMHV